MSSKILIKDATIITMDNNKRVYEKSDLLINNGIIKAISPSGSAGHEADQVLSGTGKVVIPGLINAHNHAAMSLFRSYADDYPLMEWLEKKIFPAEAKLEPEDTYWGALLAMLEMIRGGTTTFVDMYFYMEQTAQACLESGMRAMLSQVFIGENAVPGFNSLEDVKSFTEQWDNAASGRINTILGPHAPYTCSPEFLQKVLRVSEDTRPLIHIHLSESRQEVEQSLKEYNKTPVAVMQEIGMFEREVLAAHCVHLTDEDIEILSTNKVGIAHNPGSNMKLGNGVAPLTRLLENDALVGLGTDGPASNNNLDMFEEIRLAALLQKGFNENPVSISAEQALSLATSSGARALKKDDIGVIEAGKKADLVILDFNQPHLQPESDPVANIVYSALSSDVETVIIDGSIVYNKGEFLTLDREKIIYEANGRAKRLRQ